MLDRPLAETRRPRLQHAALVALGALLLLWSAILNGRPAAFPDTALYYSEGEYLAEAIGLASPADRIAPHDPTELPARPGAANVSATIDGARSPVYAAFVYGLERLGGGWLLAGVQASLVAFVLLALVRASGVPRPGRTYLAVTAALAAATGLPFFASFMMPDVFAGVAGAAAIPLIVLPDRLSGRSRAALTALLAFSMAVHRSILVDVAALSAGGAVLLALLGLRRRAVLGRIARPALAGVLAFGACAALTAPIELRAGEALHDPPFLAARVLVDGPGRRYLEDACARGVDYALCDFQDQPMEDSDAVLWSPRRKDGVFGIANVPTRLRIEREEPRFVLGTLLYDPLGEFAAMARNTLRQLKMNHVGSPLADPARFVDDGYWRRTSLPELIPGLAPCERPGACASRIPARPLADMQDAILLLTLGVLAWRLTRPDALAALAEARGAPADDRTRMFCALALLCLLVLVNAAVCGALSAPVGRYQARLIWLLPALTTLTLLTFRRASALAVGNAAEPGLSAAFSEA